VEDQIDIAISIYIFRRRLHWRGFAAAPGTGPHFGWEIGKVFRD
jgi:hypothetical protein